jgi:hypothetical protein
MTGGEFAAAIQRNAIAAIVNVARIIATVYIILSLLDKRANTISS